MKTILRHGDTDMTAGSIPRLLVDFAVPLLIGNIFQQLYNTVDSIIVGNYVSKQALAAVGCTGPIINTLIGLFIGLASGAGVVISQYYGARDGEKLHSAVQTALTLTLIMCAALTALGVAFTPAMLRMMDTPADVYPAAVEYLRIYFWGVSGLLLYNIGSGILRAVGNSTQPLYFLIFSALTNTVLDIVFVKYLGMGIAGAAIATVAAQAMSAALVLAVLAGAKAQYRLNMMELSLSAPILRKICIIGVPSALQLAITAFSNIFVQSYVNHFDSSAMAGWTAYVKIDSLAMLPTTSLSMSITTFVGQNLGAGKYDRVRAVPKYGLGMGLALMAALLLPLMLFAPQLIALFNPDPEVLRFGSLFIRLISPFYMVFTVNQVYTGLLRGAGDTKTSMFIMLGSFVVTRQIYLYIVYRLGGGIAAIGLGYPVGWMTCALGLLVYYYFAGGRKRLSPAVRE